MSNSDKRNNMYLDPLTAVSPLDGRYWDGASELSEYFSEYGLIRKRITVECEYLIALSLEKGVGILPIGLLPLPSWVAVRGRPLSIVPWSISCRFLRNREGSESFIKREKRISNGFKRPMRASPPLITLAPLWKTW